MWLSQFRWQTQKKKNKTRAKSGSGIGMRRYKKKNTNNFCVQILYFIFVLYLCNFRALFIEFVVSEWWCTPRPLPLVLGQWVYDKWAKLIINPLGGAKCPPTQCIQKQESTGRESEREKRKLGREYVKKFVLDSVESWFVNAGARTMGWCSTIYKRTQSARRSWRQCLPDDVVNVKAGVTQNKANGERAVIDGWRSSKINVVANFNPDTLSKISLE